MKIDDIVEELRKSDGSPSKEILNIAANMLEIMKESLMDEWEGNHYNGYCITIWDVKSREEIRDCPSLQYHIEREFKELGIE